MRFLVRGCFETFRSPVRAWLQPCRERAEKRRALAPEVRRWPSAAEAAVSEAPFGTVKTVPLQHLQTGFAIACNLLLLVAAALIACATALAQAPTFDLGKTATPEELQKWDIAIGPSGKELPPGSGTAKDGADLFAKKCAVCHGKAGEGTQLGPLLVATNGKRSTIMGWPFATIIWDFINRAMPINAEGTLSANEVYGLTAFLLAKNGAIQESDVLDSKAVPKVAMPNFKRFTAPPTDWKPWMPRPLGAK